MCGADELAMNLHPATLRLVHDGAQWIGSFHRLALALLRDQLTDGPIKVVAIVEGPAEQLTRITAAVIAVDDQRITFDGGREPDVQHLLAIGI